VPGRFGDAHDSARNRHISGGFIGYRFTTPRVGFSERQAKRSTPSPGRARQARSVVLGRARSLRLRTRHCVL